MKSRALTVIMCAFLFIGLSALSAEAITMQYYNISGAFYTGEEDRYDVVGTGTMVTNDGIFDKNPNDSFTNFDDLYVSFNFTLQNHVIGPMEGSFVFSVILDVFGGNSTYTIPHDYLGVSVDGTNYYDQDPENVFLYFGQGLSLGNAFDFGGGALNSYDSFSLSFNKTGEEHYPVPEPASIILLGSGCLALIGGNRKRKSRRCAQQ